MKETKAVIFDKDGTILEFSDIWIRACEEIIDNMDLSQDAKAAKKLGAGIAEDGSVIAGSALGSGTNEDIAKAIDIDISDLNDKFALYLENNKDKLVPRKSLQSLLSELKDRDLKIGLVTSDSYELTLKQLEILDIYDYFDFIYTGDMLKAKPDPQILYDIEDKHSISLDEMIYIGDTKSDMEFAKHTSKAIAIRSQASPDNLSDLADVTIEDLDQILDYI